MTANPILQDMAARLAHPHAWTRIAAARDAQDDPVSPLDPHATCWCLIGARTRAHHDIDPEKFSQVHQANYQLALTICDHWPNRVPHRERHPSDIIAQFNDHAETVHQDIIRLLELAQQ